MIAEMVPGVNSLSTQEKLVLVDELLAHVEAAEATSPFDNAVKNLLDTRFEHYRQNPETAVSWEDVKKSLER